MMSVHENKKEEFSQLLKSVLSLLEQLGSDKIKFGIWVEHWVSAYGLHRKEAYTWTYASSYFELSNILNIA